MGTPFSTIVDRALITIEDYKLNKLFNLAPDDFKARVTSYVVKAVPQFTQCLKSLSYDIVSKEFDETLDEMEINILADYVGIVWYQGELQDVLEFKEALQDKEFKRYSTGQNLTPRRNYLTDLYVRVSQYVTDYQIVNISSLPYFGGSNNV